MASGTVNKRSVDGLEPGVGDHFLWDDGLRGFGVKVTPAGAKVYLLQYRLGGRGAKVRRYTIGLHGSPWTPTTARTEAERLMIQVRQGVDIVGSKKDRERQARDLGFAAYVERFVEGCLKEHWPSSYRDAEATLRRNAIPVLRDKALPAITRSDLKTALDRVRAKTATRRNLYAVLRRLFRWAVSEGDLEKSPLEGLEAPPLPEKRDRVLADWELHLAYGSAADLSYPFGPLFRILILTAQRVEEVSRVDWSELDRREAVWSIPKERAKNRQATDVPLSAEVVAQFDKLAGGLKWPRRGLVFTTTGKTPVSGFSRAKRRLDDAMKTGETKRASRDADDAREIQPWRLHDLRRTAATGLQRLGIRFEVTEAILNHVGGSRSGVAGVYQRHDWKEEKRAALDAWACFVDGLAAPAKSSNVIRLGRVRDAG